MDVRQRSHPGTSLFKMEIDDSLAAQTRARRFFEGSADIAKFRPSDGSFFRKADAAPKERMADSVFPSRVSKSAAGNGREKLPPGVTHVAVFTPSDGSLFRKAEAAARERAGKPQGSSENISLPNATNNWIDQGGKPGNGPRGHMIPSAIGKEIFKDDDSKPSKEAISLSRAFSSFYANMTEAEQNKVDTELNSHDPKANNEIRDQFKEYLIDNGKNELADSKIMKGNFNDPVPA